MNFNNYWSKVCTAIFQKNFIFSLISDKSDVNIVYMLQNSTKTALCSQYFANSNVVVKKDIYFFDIFS